jgi:hypothetical protein
MFEIDGEAERDGSWYQRLAKVILDLCVSLLSPFVVKYSSIKVPRGSKDSKYRISKRNINCADTTKAHIYAAWTQGSLSAPKIGESFAPEHPPLPLHSLDQWISKLNAGHGESRTPASPPPVIEKFRSFSSIEAMADENRDDGENDSLDIYEMAAAKDDEMKQLLHDQISKDLPAVCASSKSIDSSTLRRTCLKTCFSVSLPILSESLNPLRPAGPSNQRNTLTGVAPNFIFATARNVAAI